MSGQLPHTSPSCSVTRLNQGYSLVRKKKQGTKFGVPRRRDNFPTSPPPCCVTRLNQGYSLVRRKKQENSLESLGVGTTSPYLPSLLRDQTQQGLFSREKKEAGKNVTNPWTLGQLPYASPPCCVTRFNQGYSLVRRKNQGTKFGVPGCRDKFTTAPLPAA